MVHPKGEIYRPAKLWASTPSFLFLDHLEWVMLFFVAHEIECWLGLVSSGFLISHNSRLTVGQPSHSTGVQTMRGYSIIRGKYQIGLYCVILRMGGVPAAFSGGCMMLRPLYCYCYDSRFSGCTILLDCISRCLGLSEGYCIPPFVLTSMQHVSCRIKSKPDNSKPKSLPLTVYYTNLRGLRGIYTDLEAFVLKHKPGIFALCETYLHDEIQDSDFQLPVYLPIHRKDAGHMHSLGVYVMSNLPVARDVKSNLPVARDVKSNLPVARDVKSNLPVAWDVKSNLPVARDVKSNLPVARDVKSNLPVACDVKSNLPVARDVKSNLPVARDVKSNLPVARDVKSNLPVARDVKSNLPVARDVKSNLPVARDVKSNLPVARDVKSNLPVAQDDVKSNLLVAAREMLRAIFLLLEMLRAIFLLLEMLRAIFLLLEMLRAIFLLLEMLRARC